MKTNVLRLTCAALAAGFLAAVGCSGSACGGANNNNSNSNSNTSSSSTRR